MSDYSQGMSLALLGEGMPQQQPPVGLLGGMLQQNPAHPPEWWNRGVRNVAGGLLGGLADLATFPGRYARGETGYVPGQMASEQPQATKWAGEMGLNMLGAPAAVGGVPGVGSGVGRGIKAYHGSPHNFDRFDLSKIGTGEGTQMQGKGIYFGQSPDVADFYHTSTVKELMAREARAQQPLHPDQQRQLVEQIAGIVSKRGGIKKIDEYGPPPGYEKAWNAAVSAVKNVGGMKGSRYEVNIRANLDDFYDLDKTLKEQPPAVYDAINRVGRDPKWAMDRIPDDARGSQLRPLLNNVDAVRDLAARGVPGTKYWDQFSRKDGEGTKNLVVFDDKLIDILRKYGLAGAPASGLAGALAGGTNDALAGGATENQPQQQPGLLGGMLQQNPAQSPEWGNRGVRNVAGDLLGGPQQGQRTHPMNNRPILQNPDGSIATEESITIEHPRMNGGRPTNIPSIWGGQRPPFPPNTREFEDWAVDNALKSGQQFPPFNSIDEAVSAARARSNELGKYR